jgi:addiction module HigA family antidote
MGRFVFHPGEFLGEILAERGLSQAEFARAIGVSPMRVSHVINKARPVTADLALRLAKAFNQTPQYWLNLQTAYDLARAASKAKAIAAARAAATRQAAAKRPAAKKRA